jgi:hypothetical protein
MILMIEKIQTIWHKYLDKNSKKHHFSKIFIFIKYRIIKRAERNRLN